MSLTILYPDFTRTLKIKLDDLCTPQYDPQTDASSNGNGGNELIMCELEILKFIDQVKEAMVSKQQELLEPILRQQNSYVMSPTGKKVLSIILLIVGIAAIITACALAIAIALTLGTGLGAAGLVAGSVVASLGGINAVAIISAVGASVGIASTIISSFLIKRATLQQRHLSNFTSQFVIETGG